MSTIRNHARKSEQQPDLVVQDAEDDDDESDVAEEPILGACLVLGRATIESHV